MIASANIMNAIWATGSVQTPGNAVTTIVTIAVPTNKTIYYVGIVTGRLVTGTPGASGCFMFSFAARNVAGVVTAINLSIPGSESDPAAATLAVTGAAAGLNMLLQVTGFAGTTVDWQATGYYQIVP